MHLLTKAAGWPAGTVRLILDEIDSTNAEAARRAPILDGPAWIFTHRQTQGRGRRGRAWTDPVGNFAGTYVFKPTQALPQVALNSFVAAVSLLAALRTLAPSGGYALKWPNDILLNGQKIVGILLESTGNSGGADWLAIGMGVNLRGSPNVDQVEARATAPSSIEQELGVVIDPLTLLDELAAEMEYHRQMFETQGFDVIRNLWLRDAAKLGERITARTMRDETTGTFEDIDAEGNLILRTPKGRTAITAADVYF